MLYKGVNVATRPPEGDPAEAGGLLASSLPWSINSPAQMPDSPGLIWPKVEVPDGVPSRGQIELLNLLTMCKQLTDWILVFDGNTRNHLIGCKQISSDSLENDYYKLHLQIIFMHKWDLALNNLQVLICHKTQSINQTVSFTMCMCDSKAVQMNRLYILVQELLLYKFKVGCNVAEALKNICCAKREVKVDHR